MSYVKIAPNGDITFPEDFSASVAMKVGERIREARDDAAAACEVKRFSKKLFTRTPTLYRSDYPSDHPDFDRIDVEDFAYDEDQREDGVTIFDIEDRLAHEIVKLIKRNNDVAKIWLEGGFDYAESLRAHNRGDYEPLVGNWELDIEIVRE